jgi:sugar O-acyltransferase (sialic acid O-acetyltransferase NeuD family)
VPDPAGGLRAVIFGARADGSAKVLLDIMRCAGRHEVVGFLDDDASRHGASVEGLPVLGGSDLFARLRRQGIQGIAFALGSNRARNALLDRARADGLEPVTAIHPSAVIASGVRVGAGVWMAAGVIVNPGCSIGDGAVINTGATVDHDCTIGEYANVSPGCHLSGRTLIGRYAFLGTGAVTLPDADIGEDAVVGAGSVVLRRVLAGCTVAGNPAREVRPDSRETRR